MTNLQNFAAQQLTKNQMNDVKGGISREEYCATLEMIMEEAFQHQDWTPEQWSNATAAYNKYCV